MASIAQGKVQRAVEELLDSLEKERLRPLVRQSYLNGAKCCENEFSSKEQLQNCIQSGFQASQKAQETISHELSRFENRLSRCATTCQDNIQDKVSAENLQPHEISKYENELETCIVKCCEDSLQQISLMKKRLTEMLPQISK